MKYFIIVVNMLIGCLVGTAALAGNGTLYFIQGKSINVHTYAVGSHIEDMLKGFHSAINAFNVNFPNLACQPDIKMNFNLRSDAELYDEVERISNLPGRNVIVGLSRTNFARLAARAAMGKDTIGISTTTVSNELRNINSNFISVGSMYQRHWESTAAGLKQLNCTPDNTLGIFAFKDVSSGYFRKSFLSAGYTMQVDIDEFISKPNIQSKVKCAYLGTTASASVTPLSKLLAMNWPGVIIGIHDWTYFSAEIRTVLADYKKRASHVYAPVIWRPNETTRSQKLIDRYFGDLALIEPIHIANFDSTIIALNYLCRNQDILNFDKDRWKTFGTIRRYRGMSASGNLESDIQFVELPLVEWNGIKNPHG